MKIPRLFFPLFFVMSSGACNSPPDGLLTAARKENASIVQLRNVHSEGDGIVCGEAVDNSGEIDRFYGYYAEQEAELTLESKIDLATQKGIEMGPEFASIGPRLKAGFLRDYERCMSSERASDQAVEMSAEQPLGISL